MYSLLKVNQHLKKYVISILRSLNEQSSACYLLDADFLAYSLTLQMESTYSSETSIHFQQSTRCSNCQDRTQHAFCILNQASTQHVTCGTGMTGRYKLCSSLWVLIHNAEYFKMNIFFPRQKAQSRKREPVIVTQFTSVHNPTISRDTSVSFFSKELSGVVCRCI